VSPHRLARDPIILQDHALGPGLTDP